MGYDGDRELNTSGKELGMARMWDYEREGGVKHECPVLLFSHIFNLPTILPEVKCPLKAY